MVRRNVKRPTLRELALGSGSVSSGELAAALGISRQAAHAQLRRAVEEGLLRPVGRGRTARYELTHPSLRYPIAGAAEDRILSDVERRVPELAGLDPETTRAFRYAFSELVNNALDHSGGEWVEVAVRLERTHVSFTVQDDGVGALERVRVGRGLEGHVEAAAELTKGKVTTMPERHSGEGIFFSSRVAARFELHANGHALVVDGARDDTAILAEQRAHGTRVVVTITRPPARSLVDVFAAYTEDYEFVRTRTVVRLFAQGRDFVSRSEARRLMNGLERFREVVLDFSRVPGIGQGFADEIFRVWSKSHPTVVLSPIEMNDDTRFFVERARRAARG